MPGAECGARAAREGEHLPHHGGGADAGTDRAVVMGITEADMLEPDEIPDDMELAVVLAEVEIAGAENVDQEPPHIVGLARIDKGESMQGIVGGVFTLS